MLSWDHGCQNGLSRSLQASRRVMLISERSRSSSIISSYRELARRRHSMINAHNSLQRGKRLERTAVMLRLVMLMARSIAPAVTIATLPTLALDDVTGNTVRRFWGGASIWRVIRFRAVVALPDICGSRAAGVPFDCEPKDSRVFFLVHTTKALAPVAPQDCRGFFFAPSVKAKPRGCRRGF